MFASKKSVVPLFTAVSLAAPVSQAAEDVPAVMVSATRSAQSNVPIAASISIITHEEIARSGATHISQVLRGRGGVQLRDDFGDGSGAVVSMRGFGENAAANTLVMVDGRRLNNTDLAAPDLNSIALKDVERIEIIQGGAGTLFGDQAVGGVINVITKRPTEYSANIEVGAASYSGRSAIGSVSNRMESGLSYRFSGETRTTDNYRDNNDRDYTNVFGRLDYTFGRADVFVEQQFIDENLDTPGAIFEDQVDDDPKQTRFPADFIDTRTYVSRIGTRTTLSDRWMLEGELAYRRNDSEGILTNIATDQNRRHTTFTPRWIGTVGMPAGDALITTGVDYDTVDYDFFAFGNTENDQDLWAVYAQAVVPLTSRISATLGSRYAEVENDLIDDFAFAGGTNIDDDAFVSEVGFSAQINPELRAYVRRDGVFRFAKVDEYTFADGELETQTGASYELGTEWRDNRYNAKAVLYRLDLEDEIAFDPSAFFGFGANRNLDDTQRNGLILEGGAQLTSAFRIDAQYSYTDAEFDNGSFDGNRIPMVAEDVVRVAADYQIIPPLSVFLEGYYVSDRVASGDDANALAELDSYTVYNLNLGYQRGPWGLSFRVNNLLDEEYSDNAVKAFNPWPIEETGFYPAPERNYRVALQYRFD